MQLYVETLGFTVLFRRPEERFVYLEREGAHLMLEEVDGPGRRFRTAELQQPFGRGLNLQIRTTDALKLRDAVVRAGFSPLIEIEERW